MSFWRKPNIYFIYLLALLMLALFIAGCADKVESEAQDIGKLRIYFIDVGKGDAALIGTPDDKWIMVDVGHKDEYAQVVRLLKQNDVKELEAIFISHQHNDHFSALADVLAHVSCKIIYTTPHLDVFKHEQRFSEMADNAGVSVEFLYPGDQIDIAGIDIDILGPNGRFSEEDDNSLVQMINWGSQNVLFTGDQRHDAEKALLKKGYDIKCDVLKAGNHGRNASSEAFLKATGANYSIITNDFKGKEYDASVSHFASFDMRVYVLGETGTMLCELENGDVGFFAVKPPVDEPALSVSISEFDRNEATAVITNNSEQDAVLKGWCLRSEKGKDTYFFPDETVLKKGASLNVSSDVFGNIKKKDALGLYDQYSRELDITP